MGYTSLLGELKKKNKETEYSFRKKNKLQDQAQTDENKEKRLEMERNALLKKFYKK